MAKKKTNDIEAARAENIQETVSRTDQFYNENKKTIWTIVCILCIVVLAVFAYYRFVYQPKCAEALQQAYPAEQCFIDGEWELALKGDGNILGLEDVIAQYGSKAGKAVYLEAAICSMNLSEFEQALDYLAKYKSSDPIMAARAIALEGDAYTSLGRYSEAVAAYKKAAAKADNDFAAGYLLKAGIVSEEAGDAAGALSCYETIKDKYPETLEGSTIDKYITRIQQ